MIRRGSELTEYNAVVFIIDGAGGSGFTPLVIRRALAGLPYKVEHFRWGTGYMRIISDLTNRTNMRQKSDELRSAIAGYRNENPHHRIYIVAKSAGTAVALNALAKLPEDTVDRVVLMSPAVSPSFPLVDSLRAVRGDVISFCSAADLLFLKVGTSLFGTADGIRGVAAGLRGFVVPEDSSLAHQYSKLHEIHWNPSMMKLMHFGDHSGNSMPLFVKQYILPLLLEKELSA
jgi:pimeloyl-ACP methyl ester carboxylesterase